MAAGMRQPLDSCLRVSLPPGSLRLYQGLGAAVSCLRRPRRALARSSPLLRRSQARLGLRQSASQAQRWWLIWCSQFVRTCHAAVAWQVAECSGKAAIEHRLKQAGFVRSLRPNSHSPVETRLHRRQGRRTRSVGEPAGSPFMGWKEKVRCRRRRSASNFSMGLGSRSNAPGHRTRSNETNALE